MMYAVCQINGKQYKVEAGKTLEIDLTKDGQKTLFVKVLLISEDNKIKLGKPFLRDELTLDILDNIKKEKLRVGKYHSKANYRKVTGQRAEKSRVVWNMKSA